MASKEKDEDLDLLDVMLYAPVGFLYEYRKVMPQLVKKGRSQMQLGMFIGRMAASKGSAGAERAAADALTTMATIAARGITEFGQAVGLAPPEDEAPPVEVTTELPPPPDAGQSSAPKDTPATKPAGKKSVSKKSAGKKSASKKAAAPKGPRLPIAGYDELTAREVVALVGDLTAPQRARLRKHEEANRNRKTILAKLDRLDA